MWTAKDAWELVYGSKENFPPAVEVPTDSFQKGIAELVASYFGEVNDDSVAKAHTALMAVCPLLVEYPLPPATQNGKKLRGTSFREHLSTTIAHLMLAYAPTVGCSVEDIEADLHAVLKWRLADVKDWWYIWEAISSLGAPDQDVADFCQFALLMRTYTDMQPNVPFMAEHN